MRAGAALFVTLAMQDEQFAIGPEPNRFLVRLWPAAHGKG